MKDHQGEFVVEKMCQVFRSIQKYVLRLANPYPFNLESE